MSVIVVCSAARLSRGIYSQLVLSLSSEEHGVKEKGIKGVASVVRSIPN